ncbi:MAG: peptidyl-prolyl cis-trans isomerase [Candidatus Latescibacteria bacterium]|nr:peptidyl-prolyl cis-trans isomerase [Candidatus Latescibacterota bacterium]
MKIHCWVVVLAALAMGGCGENEDPAVLARVGEVRITAAMLQGFEAKLPASKGPVDHRANLQTLVDRELLLQEARAQGLDKDAEVLKSLEQREVKELANQMMRRQVLDRVSVTEEQVSQAYTQGGWNRQVVTEEIFVADEARARQAVSLLKGGARFETVADQFAVDRIFKMPTKASQPFVYSPQDAPRAVVEAVNALPVGGITAPIFVRDGYVIARVVEQRPVALEVVRDKIFKSLQRQQKNELKDGYLLHLHQELKIQEQPQGMDVVMGVLTGKVEEPDAEQRRLPVYTYGDRQLSVEEVLEVALPARDEWPAVTKEQLVGELANGFFSRMVMAQDARRKGLDQQEGFRQWRQREQEDLMIARLRSQTVAKIEVTQADLEAYYEAHRQTYRVPAAAKVQEVLLEDPDQARALAQQVQNGADLAALAKTRSIRKGHQDGALLVYGLQGPIFGEEWVKAVMNVPLDTVQGPLRCKGGYSVFKVIERQSESYFGLELKGVLRAVTREVTEEKERRAFNAFLEELRRQRQAQVRIFEDHLNAATPAKEAVGV